MRHFLLVNSLILIILVFPVFLQKNQKAGNDRNAKEKKEEKFVQITLINKDLKMIPKFESIQKLFNSSDFKFNNTTCTENEKNHVLLSEVCSNLKKTNNITDYTLMIERKWGQQKTEKNDQGISFIIINQTDFEKLSEKEIKEKIDKSISQEIMFRTKDDIDLWEIPANINSIIYISLDSSVPVKFSQLAFENKGKILFGFVNSEGDDKLFQYYYGNQSLPFLVGIDTSNPQTISYKFFPAINLNLINSDLKTFIADSSKAKKGNANKFLINPRDEVLLFPNKDLNFTNDTLNLINKNEILLLIINSKDKNALSKLDVKEETKGFIQNVLVPDDKSFELLQTLKKDIKKEDGNIFFVLNNTNISLMQKINDKSSLIEKINGALPTKNSQNLTEKQLMDIGNFNSDDKMIFILFDKFEKNSYPLWYKLLINSNFYLKYYSFYTYHGNLSDQNKTKLEITDYPSIIVLMPNKDKSMDIVHFPFSFESKYISSLVNELIGVEEYKKAYSFLEFPNTYELTKEQKTDTQDCTFNSLCFVLFVDANNKSRFEYLNITTLSLQNNNNSPGKFFWINTEGKEDDLMKQLDLRHDNPTLIAINPNAKKYVKFLGKFELASIRLFLIKVKNMKVDKIGKTLPDLALIYFKESQKLEGKSDL